MIGFWVGAVLLGLLAAAFVMLPLWWQRRHGTGGEVNSEVDGGGGGTSRQGVNLRLFAGQRAELDAQLAAGELGQDEYAALLAELERAVLDDIGSRTDGAKMPPRDGGERWLLGSAVAVPVLALGLYMAVGYFADLRLAADLRELMQAGGGGQAQEQTQEQVSEQEQMARVARMVETVRRLQRRMQGQPDNVHGWLLLAASQMGLGLYEPAARSYGHLLDRYPGDVNLLAGRAEALFLAAGGQVDGPVRAAVDELLRFDADAPMANEILAMDAVRGGDVATGIGYFEQVLTNPEVAAERREVIEQVLVQLRDGLEAAGIGASAAAGVDSAAAGADGPAASVGSAAADVDGAAAGVDTNNAGANVAADVATDRQAGNERRAEAIDVHVELAPGVPSAPADTVFVYARAVGGPPMPVAIERLTAADLPTTVVLDDNDSLMGGRLSRLHRFEVIARLSRSGQAAVQPGDHVAETGPLDAGEVDGVISLLIGKPVE